MDDEDSQNAELLLHHVGEILTGGSGGDVAVGSIVAFAGSVAPSGWLLCDGSAVSRTVYADLFAVVGEQYGAGDGSSTFNLPDLRGRLPLGRDNMGGTSANRVVDAAGSVLGGDGGSDRVTLDTDEIPAHAHAVGRFAYAPSGGTGGIVSSSTANSVSSGATGGGESHENMPPYLTTSYIIRT